jgi:ABC-2 type transport system permease protein
MRKTWIFFMLRLVQLKYDKVGLFFSYALPVMMLLGIGSPLQGNPGAPPALAYRDSVGTEQSKKLLEDLRESGKITLSPYERTTKMAMRDLEANEIKNFLDVVQGTNGVEYRLYSNSLAENQLINAAVFGAIDRAVDGRPAKGLVNTQIKSSKYTSYIVILLPGLIGMTLLIIALNGFASVLIYEEHSGIFKSIKSVDASPTPFLAGLFCTRLLVTYTVAILLFAISILYYGIPSNIDYLLLFLVVTMGAIAFHGIGLAITTISPSLNVFNGIMSFTQIPLVILGGVFFPTSVFPEWLQTVSNLLPLTQFNQALQALFFDGVGLSNPGEIAPQLIGLCFWSVLSLLVARFRFRW